LHSGETVVRGYNQAGQLGESICICCWNNIPVHHLESYLVFCCCRSTLYPKTMFLFRNPQNNKFAYSSVLHSHTVLMKLYPCGRYRQLNSVLYPNNRVLKSSKQIFNWLVLKEFSACRQFESR